MVFYKHNFKKQQKTATCDNLCAVW